MSKRIRRNVRCRLVVETLETREVPAAEFQINSLTASSVEILDHSLATGDDHGGISIAGTQVLVTGDDATARFDKSPLGGGVSVGNAFRSLFTDLKTNKSYVFGSSALTPIDFPWGGATHVIEVLPSGALGGAIALSLPVTLAAGAGIFAGYGRVLVHPGTGAVQEVLLPSGAVSNLPAIAAPTHQVSDTSFTGGLGYWGVAERFGGQDYIAYVRDTTTIARTRLSDGVESTVATFFNLGDMASFVVSPANDRWYFHNEGFSEFFFGGFQEILGSANASFTVVDYMVTNLADAGPGSLRQAILDANAEVGVQSIGFQTGLNGTITVDSNLTISSSERIVGPGASTITVQGSAGKGVLIDGSGGLLNLTISGLTLRNAAGFNFPYALNATDLVIDAVAANVVFTNSLTVNTGSVTLIDGNAVELGSSTQVNASLSAANGLVLSSGDTLSGSGFVSGSVTVGSGGTLAMTGTVSSNVTVQNGGSISPAGTSNLTVTGNLQIQNGGTLVTQFDGPFDGQYDRLTVGGGVDIGLHTNLVPTLNYAASPNQSLILIDQTGGGSVVGRLNNARNGSGLNIGGGTLFHVRYDGGDGNDVELVVNSAPVVNTVVDTDLSPILEDVPPSSNPGTTVDKLIATGGLYSDAQGLFRAGIAVTGLASGSGTWQFSQNGGANWAPFGAVSNSSATLLEADGGGLNRVRFLPNGNFFGTATLSFRGWDAADGLLDGSTGVNTSTNGGNASFSSATETASILVLAVNDHPIATADSYSIGEDGTLNEPVGTGVLANDTDIDGPLPLLATLISGPSHGALALQTNGSFSYTPTANYFGSDAFTYKVQDSEGAFDVSTVTLTVTPGNDPPGAVDDTATVPEDGGAVTIDVLANDFSAPDAPENLTVTSATSGLRGTVGISADNKFVTYIPDANYNGTDSFTYTVSDGNGGFDMATVNVTVTSVNDLPDARNDIVSVNEDGGAQTVSVLGNDTFAPDAGETLKIETATHGQHGLVVVAGDGLSFTYTPDIDYAGPDTILYTISDGNGGTDLAAVTINVINDAADRLEVVTTNGLTTFTENGGPVLVDAGVRVGTGLEGVITSATIKFTAGYVKNKDKLQYVAQPGIKGSFNVATGTLSLKGTALPSAYQTAIQSVTYVNLSPAPVDGIRTVGIKLFDTAGVGTEGVKLVRVIGVNSKAIVTITGPAPPYNTFGKPKAIASTLKIKDIDNTRLVSAKVSFVSGFNANDVLSVTTKPGIVVSFSNVTGELTLTGNSTLANYMAVLKSLKFTTIAGVPGPRTLSITVNDGVADSDPVTRVVTVA